MKQSQKNTKPWDPKSYNVPPKEGKTRFHDLNISETLLHAVSDLDFEYCTPIQAAILPEILKGRDAIGHAQTGTGKTAAFLICIYSHLLKKNSPQNKQRAPSILILAPTRELALQINEEASEIGRYTPFQNIAIYGGIDYENQRQKLKQKKIDVVIATPGRLLDYYRNKVLHLNKIDILVIDEADRMLDMGFIPDVKRIVYATPHKEKRQTLFFSATINEDVLRLAKQWTRGAIKVEIEMEQVAAKNVKQIVYLTTQSEKISIVYNLLKQHEAKRVLIFCNRRDSARKLCEALRAFKFNCALLSGEIDQTRRIKTLKNFRNGRIDVLVATDVAGRGIHVESINYVINFDLPEYPEDYVHRIGRTGRAGEIGISISFACESDAFQIPEIETFLGNTLKCVYPEESLLKPLP